MNKNRVFSGKCGELLATYDPESSSWKMCQMSFDWAEPMLLVHLPKSGIVSNGKLYRLTDKSFYISNQFDFNLPTPTASDYKRRGPNSKQQGLSNIENWQHLITRKSKLSKGNNFSLNPDFVVWMMGFPLNYLTK